jgi:hypothetical protein
MSRSHISIEGSMEPTAMKFPDNIKKAIKDKTTAEISLKGKTVTSRII